MNSFFDKIYIINLKRSVERRDHQITQMKKYNITNYVFIEGILGSTVNMKELKKTKQWAFKGNDFCKNTCSCKGGGHFLTANQIGLFQAHYNIWKDMLKNNYTKCLILEDDCIFTEAVANFNTVIKDIPDNWELLYLGHAALAHSAPNENSSFKKLLKGIAQAHIYAITSECAKILIQHTYPFRAAVDGYFAHFMTNNKVLKNVYSSKTHFGTNGSLYTEKGIRFKTIIRNRW